MGNFKKSGDPSNCGDDFEMGGGGWYLFMEYVHSYASLKKK